MPIHIAVDTRGELLARRVTAASADGREQVFALTAEVQEVTGRRVTVEFVDPGYTGGPTGGGRRTPTGGRGGCRSPSSRRTGS